ncbi:recombinase family protein [Streptomyces katsurahamanus]|uniref:Recombinase family protein n=1 Tax=Streptomyces katsurahamanus TaxID=2577098 RepID=A0ABW9NSI8_9ACTN|nr:recombinase family protein [Streptomyces katsurahamanus]MQS36116.1 recombinase family protein [Streptomyces katsurahamanus]
MTQLRALSAIRLSVRTDETTSPGRQRAANSNEAARRGAVIVGEAEDLDVSATKTTPFNRPELGAWLQRPDDFDVIIWWRMDRAVRSMADMAELGRWAKTHGKLLVFAEGPGGTPMDLDMRTVSPVSELIMTLLAFSAQMESTAIRERVTGAQSALRSQGRYSGGLVPYGYGKVANPDGPGWKLAPDAGAVKVLSGIIRDVLDGQSLTAVAMALNEDNVPVPRDYQAIKAGRDPGGTRRGRQIERFKWTAGTLSKVLRSPALMGYRLHQGKPVRDRDGNPVPIGDPVLSQDEFDALQDHLATLTPQKNRTRKATQAMLLGVAKCRGCGGNLYLSKRAGGADYNCRATARGDRCPSPAGIRADWLEKYVEEEIMARVGDLQMTKAITRKGYDPAPELREVMEELRALYADKGARRSRTGRMIWQEEVDTLERRAEVLEATPRTEARTEVVPTGETYASFWVRHDTVGRRQLLLDTDARVTVAKGRSGGGAERLTGPDRARMVFTISANEHPHAMASTQ